MTGCELCELQAAMERGENLEFLRLSWTGVQEQDDSVRRASVAALFHELERADVVIERAYA